MKWLIGIGNRIRDGFHEFDWDDFWDDFWGNKFPFVLILAFVSLGILGVILAATGVLDDGKPTPKDDHVKVLSVRGEPHEYLDYDRGITHLPNCKYCKGETK